MASKKASLHIYGFYNSVWSLTQYLHFHFRYSRIFRSTRAWFVLVFCWFLCILVAIVTSISDEPSIWQICTRAATDNQDDFWHFWAIDGSFTLAILQFIVLFCIPLILIELIYIRIYLAARANSDKLRSKTSACISGISVDSNLCNISSSYELAENTPIRKGSNETNGNGTADDTGSDQLLASRSTSFSQRFARSASNASTTLITNIRKKVLATNHFIKVRTKSAYSKVSNKRTVFNNRAGGDIILQKV